MDPDKVRMGIKGFWVQSKEPSLQIEKEGGVVKWDNPVCNVDNCFNIGNGVFTAPVTGVYSLYINGMIHSDDNMRYSDLVIEKNDGNPLQKVFLKGRADIYPTSQGSTHVRAKLEKGDNVRVRHLGGDLALRGEHQTTFSGVLEWEYPDSFRVNNK